jgi:hypothetical protein
MHGKLKLGGGASVVPALTRGFHKRFGPKHRVCSAVLEELPTPHQAKEGYVQKCVTLSRSDCDSPGDSLLKAHKGSCPQLINRTA